MNTKLNLLLSGLFATATLPVFAEVAQLDIKGGRTWSDSEGSGGQFATMSGAAYYMIPKLPAGAAAVGIYGAASTQTDLHGEKDFGRMFDSGLAVNLSWPMAIVSPYVDLRYGLLSKYQSETKDGDATGKASGNVKSYGMSVGAKYALLERVSLIGEMSVSKQQIQVKDLDVTAKIDGDTLNLTEDDLSRGDKRANLTSRAVLIGLQTQL